MSSFFCPHCAAPITDSPRGYVTGCEHYPVERKSVFTCPSCGHQRNSHYHRKRQRECAAIARATRTREPK